MGYVFRDTEQSLSETLYQTARSINSEHITLKELFEKVGEHGLLLFCALLTIPFLIPVSIPGVSTVFGLGIILIGVGIVLNRVPWLPQRLMARPIATQHLIPTLEKGAQFVTRIERFIHPRLLMLTHGVTVNRVNGSGLVFSGVLLMFPLGLVPFSNTLPALAILFLSIGIMERDGFFILGGFGMMLLTLIYFGILFLGVMLAGEGILSLFDGG
ncbi:MAG: exopolysaccharide biosynthesis protein [Anaerolineae bacterium]